MTPRQKQTLEFIRDALAANGYAPSLSEIADHLGVNRVTIFEHVAHLKAAGYLVSAHKHRGLRLTNKGNASAVESPTLRLLRDIAASNKVPQWRDAAQAILEGTS